MLHCVRGSLVCAFLGLLVGCGGGPPADATQAEIAKSVLGNNRMMFDGGSGGAEVVGIALEGWTKDKEAMAGGPVMFNSKWTARLRFKEPLACILAQVEGTRIVKVVADAGEELPFAGHVSAGDWQGEWHVNSYCGNDGDFTGPGQWKPIWDKADHLTAGYQVVAQGDFGTPKFRTVNFEPLSKLKPYAIEGSPEHQKIEAERMERLRKAQEIAAERARQRQQAQQEQQQQAEAAAAELQKKREEEQARVRAEAAERQRVAQAAAQQKQAEAAERARVAAEEKKSAAEAQRRARLLAVLKPFGSTTGAVITAEAGATLGTIILDAAIDEQKFTVSGHAVDLREMPFEEFTFDGAVDERGAFTLTTSRGGAPVAYGAAGDKLSSRAGFTIAATSADERRSLEALLALGKRLGSAAPIELAVETMDAEAAQAREPQLALTGLSGTVFHRGRVAAAVAPLFSADLGAKKAYAWRGKEIVAIRVGEPVRGKGLFVRGAATASTEMIVTINGVHRITVAAIPRLGAVIVALPADLEVLDLRLEATGAVSARTIGLVK